MIITKEHMSQQSFRKLYKREFSSYASMLSRCYCTKTTSYKYYGARGVEVCDRWIVSFWTFLFDMGLCPANSVMDRMDADSHYTPDNCVWSETSEQYPKSRGKKVSAIVQPSIVVIPVDFVPVIYPKIYGIEV